MRLWPWRRAPEINDRQDVLSMCDGPPPPLQEGETFWVDPALLDVVPWTGGEMLTWPNGNPNGVRSNCGQCGHARSQHATANGFMFDGPCKVPDCPGCGPGGYQPSRPRTVSA